MNTKFTPEIIDKIKHLAIQGFGIKHISKEIDIPRSTLKLFIVKNEIQLKDARHNKAPTKITLEMESKIKELAHKGIIATKIAQEMGLYEETIRIFCKKKDIPLFAGNVKGVLTKVTPEIENKILELAKNGLNATDIAKKIGVISKSTVQNWVKSKNLPINKGKQRDIVLENKYNQFETLLKSGKTISEAKEIVQIPTGSAHRIIKERNLGQFTRDRAQSAIEDKRIPIEIIKENVEKIGYKLISTEYLGNKEPIILSCKDHGEWVTLWNSIDQGQRCPKCSGSKKIAQKEIIQFIKTIYNGTVIEDDWDLLGNRELDIYLPELKLAIEHDGLFYHSEYIKERADKDNIYKMNKSIEKGIRLLCFFEDEWFYKQEIVKSIIKNKIGMVGTRIYARKTELVEITNKEAKEFLNANHLEGYVRSSKSFGLKYNGNLVMCVTFRKNMHKEYELSRMATLIDNTVVGGASKLLSKSLTPLVSFSNNRISNGNVYKELGFEEITETFEPSYFYTDFRKRVFRTSCQKKKGFSGDERQQALDGVFGKHFGHTKPVYRIYDYGHRKWIKK